MMYLIWIGYITLVAINGTISLSQLTAAHLKSGHP